MTSSVPIVPPFGTNAYLPFMIKVYGQTIGRRIHISPSEGENAKCSASNPQGLLNASFRSTLPSKTPSPSNVISSHAVSTSSSGKPRLRCGGNALRRPDRRHGCHRLGPIELTCRCPCNTVCRRLPAAMRNLFGVTSLNPNRSSSSTRRFRRGWSARLRASLNRMKRKSRHDRQANS